MISPYVYPLIPKFKDPKSERIIETVSEHFGLNSPDIFMPTKKREILIPRQLAIFLIRMNTKLSLHEIGKIFNKDHSSIINSVNQVQYAIELKDKLIYENYLHLVLKLKFNN